jgi:quaternary ammonium compound-resistance protein SugE
MLGAVCGRGKVMRSPEPLNSDLNPRRGAIGMAWILLFVAGLFEAGMVIGLDFSEGFTRLWPSLLTLISGGISFFLLSLAMQSIPAGTAYAVWTAIGASVVVLLGILFLGEPANLLRLAGIAVVLGGVLLLRFAEG